MCRKRVTGEAAISHSRASTGRISLEAGETGIVEHRGSLQGVEDLVGNHVALIRKRCVGKNHLGLVLVHRRRRIRRGVPEIRLRGTVLVGSFFSERLRVTRRRGRRTAFTALGVVIERGALRVDVRGVARVVVPPDAGRKLTRNGVSRAGRPAHFAFLVIALRLFHGPHLSLIHI
eukprot:2698932-Rhodomonas_salina.4